MTITLTDDQVRLLKYVLSDALDSWGETRSELARDSGEDSEDVRTQDASIRELGELILIVDKAAEAP